MRPSCIPLAGPAVSLCVAIPARAQDAAPGWQFQVGLYAWAPTFDSRLDYRLPGGRSGTASVSVDAQDYFDKINLSVMMTAEARYDRFSVLTDLIYTDFGSGSSRVNGVNVDGASGTRSLHADSGLESTVWTLAAGYTLARGGWGNVDAIGGFRYLGIDVHTDYSLALDVTAADGSVALARQGRLSGNTRIWNGIAGLHGRLRIGESGFFVPYYLDIGTGDSRLTWQVFSGIGYQTGWAGVQLGYRYLSFDQGRSYAVDSLSMGGAYLALTANF